MIEEGLPVDSQSIEGSVTKSTPDLISSEISVNFDGVLSPETFAEVETRGRPRRLTRALQKSDIGIRIPTVPSSATVLNARQFLSAGGRAPS